MIRNNWELAQHYSLVAFSASFHDSEHFYTVHANFKTKFFSLKLHYLVLPLIWYLSGLNWTFFYFRDKLTVAFLIDPVDALIDSDSVNQALLA